MNQSFNHLMIMNDDEKTAALQNVDQWSQLMVK